MAEQLSRRTCIPHAGSGDARVCLTSLPPGLSGPGRRVRWPPVTDRFQRWLPWLFAAVFALSRWPGLLPPNFSVAYALCLCAGALFPGRLSWALPLGALVVTDIALNCYYQFARGFDVWTLSGLVYLGMGYACYAVLFGLGRLLRGRARVLPLLLASLAGAVVFYVLTNTLAWLLNPFRNPEYIKTLAGWWVALTKGTGGYQETWTFFRNTLLSSALFTALFAGSWRSAPAESPREKGEEEPAAEAESPSGEARA
jgi:hypothetical protein